MLHHSTTKNYLLDNEFCVNYYPANQGLPPCNEVVKQVVANLTTTLPILELGNRSHPGMFFIHGWPDSAAEWAPQFAHFCAPPHGQFHCIAVSWTDFDPDVNPAPEDQLRLQLVIDKLAATIEEVGFNATTQPAKDTTLIIHDWGAFLGYQLMAQYPELTKRTVAFDIGFIGSNITNLTYQAVNREAYIEQNSSISIANAAYLDAPSASFATWRTVWPYCCDPDVSCGFDSMEGLNYQIPRWDQPVIFFYGTRMKGEPRPDDFYWFGSGWLKLVQNTPHGQVVAVPSFHWMHVRNASTVNAVIEGWFGSLSHTPM